MARRSLRRVAMPFLQASLVKQILIGLILGIALAYLAPEAAKACAFLGSLFIAALKAVAPLLVFVLVMSAIANQNLETRAHIKPVLTLYLMGTFGAALIAVTASFLFPCTLHLTGVQAQNATPGGLIDVLYNVLMSVVDNPVHALRSGNYMSILAWAAGLGAAMRRASESSREFMADLSQGVEVVVLGG